MPARTNQTTYNAFDSTDAALADVRSELRRWKFIACYLLLALALATCSVVELRFDASEPPKNPPYYEGVYHEYRTEYLVPSASGYTFSVDPIPRDK